LGAIARKIMMDGSGGAYVGNDRSRFIAHFRWEVQKMIVELILQDTEDLQ
jgi:hypothetical protein